MEPSIQQDGNILDDEPGGDDPRVRIIILLQDAWERFLADEMTIDEAA